MGFESNPFLGLQVASAFSIVFGVISVLIGLADMVVWMAVLGVFGPDLRLYTDTEADSEVKLRIGESNGGLSGAMLVILSACGLWCGLWMACTGACGCAIKLGKNSDQLKRTRLVVLLAAAFNAILFCPIQIALYGYLFKPVELWGKALYRDESFWWAAMFQGIGIGSGLASLILCIIVLVIACKTKPYAGEAKTWDDFDNLSSNC